MLPKLTSEFLAPTKKLRRLSVLFAIDRHAGISQHRIAKIASLSSDMVNNYMKELQREELIAFAGENNRTQSYHLTARGRQELTELLNLYSAEIAEIYGNAHCELGALRSAFNALSSQE
jgi:DNA-binding MarR family transcriptional regulator